MADYSRLSSLETTSILPVDLNCLLYMTEKTLEEIYQLNGIKDSARYYSKLANKRLKAINKVFWHKNKGFYADYHFCKRQHKVTPLCFGYIPPFRQYCQQKPGTGIKQLFNSYFS
jgi:alpha,alpha-trehalase